MKTIFLFLLSFFSAIPLTSFAQTGLFSKIQKYRQANEHAILQEYFQLLSIPNVSSDKEHIRKNAGFIRSMMQKRGINARLLETRGNPVVYGELEVPGAEQTLMFYVHYDGQPVDPTKWTESKPFEPVLRPGKLQAGTTSPKPIPFPRADQQIDENWRIYARSASDDKAPIIALLTALDALKSANIPLKSRAISW